MCTKIDTETHLTEMAALFRDYASQIIGRWMRGYKTASGVVVGCALCSGSLLL